MAISAQIPLDLINIALIVIIYSIILGVLSAYIRTRKGPENFGRRTIARLIQLLVGILLILSIILAIPGLENAITGLAIGATVIGIIIGFAAQNTIANLLSGIMIVIYKPLKVGDDVLINNEYGTVEDITLWHSIIRTWDLRRVVMPNSNLAQASFINYTAVDPKKLMWFVVGISYESDIDVAKKIIIEEAMKHPNVLPDPAPIVSVIELGDYAVKLRLLFWAKDQSTGFSTKLDLQESVKKAFDEKGIHIPCPIREISLTPELEKKWLSSQGCNL